jgi:hypothetical protein
VRGFRLVILAAILAGCASLQADSVQSPKNERPILFTFFETSPYGYRVETIFSIRSDGSGLDTVYSGGSFPVEGSAHPPGLLARLPALPVRRPLRKPVLGRIVGQLSQAERLLSARVCGAREAGDGKKDGGVSLDPHGSPPGELRGACERGMPNAQSVVCRAATPTDRHCGRQGRCLSSVMAGPPTGRSSNTDLR